jgi:hypothetical protein
MASSADQLMPLPAQVNQLTRLLILVAVGLGWRYTVNQLQDQRSTRDNTGTSG